MKRYISQSTVSFSVNIDGREKRIRFTQATQGGSSYVCDDPKICKLIESRADFGVVYFLDPNYTQENKPMKDPAVIEAPKGTASGQKQMPTEATSEIHAIINPDAGMRTEDSAFAEVTEINTPSEAKDYLIQLGAQAAAVRSRDGILQTAQEMKISFPNLK